MSRIKIDFLNWRPDAVDFENQLTECQNVLHRPEGWIPFNRQTASAVVTNTAMTTCPSMVVKTVGTNEQRIVAYLHNATAAGAGYTIDFSIGLISNGYTTVSNYTTISSSTITNGYTGNYVSAFEVAEYADKIFVTAQAELPAATVISASAPIVTLNSTGYITI